MKERKLTTDYKEYSFDELTDADRELVVQARDATRRSYAPYSKFHVGAAIRLANGEIVCGSNQENAAFSSGTCAERSACFYAGARYPDVAMDTIAIAAWSMDGKPDGLPWEEYFQETPISPCGNCRQSLQEYETRSGKPIRVLLYGKNHVLEVPSVSALLPFTFVSF